MQKVVYTEIEQMENPVVALVTLPSWNVTDLGGTMRLLRRHLKTIERRVCFKGIRLSGDT